MCVKQRQCTLNSRFTFHSPYARYSYVALFIFFLWLNILSAQSIGKLAGTVTEAKSGEPLAGANIIIVGTNMGAAADADGLYYILNVSPGKYELRAVMIGFETMKIVDVIVHGGKTTQINFKLSEEMLETEEVVVIAQRPDVEVDKTSTSAIMRFDEVQNLPGIRNISDVMSLTSDVVDGHFRGGREGEEYYTLQGLGIINPLDRSAALMPIMSGVEEVEVITSGFGAQYGNAQSGVVNISMKEGDRRTWKSRFEARSSTPGRKHFGPSVYDPEANEYLKLLLDENVWFAGDPNSTQGDNYFTSMVGVSNFGRDSLVQLAIAQELWRQTKRNIGRDYGQEMDYSVEMATGGPINEYMRMFLALRSNKEFNPFPTEDPNSEYQAMGNIVADLSEKMVLRLSGGFSHENENRYPGVNGTGYRNWIWDRIVGLQEGEKMNSQIGLRLSHALSPSTFYEIKLNSVFTENRVGVASFPNFLPDSITYNWVDGVVSWPNSRSPDGFNYQEGPDDFDEEKTRTISLDASFTSQVNNFHLFNAGLQANSYFIDVENVDNSVSPDRETENYSAHPFEAAFYMQDKMEFEGLIANVGLRLDLWYPGVDYFSDPYLPFGYQDSVGIYHPEDASTKKPPIHVRLQPRLGFSFPVSTNTVFHLNYGAFMQRPSFQYIVSREYSMRYNTPVTIGNPRLKPETTNSYDIGVVQALGDGFTIDVSGYYKDVKNLIQQARFAASGGSVTSYFNLDYADIRGFRIMLNKRKGDLRGSLNYQYSYATGKNATVNALAATEFFRDESGNIITDSRNVPTRDVLLDFDRTHNLVLTAAYVTAEEWGPSILDVKPFENLNFSTRSSVRSGRPYTSYFEPKRINVKRTPMEYNTDLRLTKSIRSLLGIPASFYLEVYNLFNNKILNYSYLFDRTGTAVNQNLPLQYYELYPVNDKQNGIRYWYNKGSQGPFSIDQSFLIYSNQPRSYSFGIVLEF